MRRLPIRIRLTAAFTLVMALLLAATGIFLYGRLRANLDASIASALSARAADVTALARQSDTALSEGNGSGLRIAELITASGRVLDRAPTLPRAPLLSASQRQAAQRAGSLRTQITLPGVGLVRLLAKPVTAQGQRLLVVVGEALDGRDQALAALRSELLVGGPVALALSCLIGYLLTAGALRPVEALRRRAAAISADDLEQRLPTVTANDELGRLQRTLEQMLARIHRSVLRERAFVSDASHELRSPLAALRVELELLAHEQPRGQQLERAVASAIEETDRLSAVAEGLLLLARADDGQLAVPGQRLAVEELLREAAGLAAAEARAGGIVLAVDETPELAVLGDRHLAVQAIHNLARNAVRHAAREVRLSAESDGELVRIHVRDDGPGFPAGFLAHAWERFARAQPARAEDGAGLGLAIVRAIAVAHGGGAGARNLPGRGADVWVSLPRLERQAAPQMASAAGHAERER